MVDFEMKKERASKWWEKHEVLWRKENMNLINLKFRDRKLENIFLENYFTTSIILYRIILFAGFIYYAAFVTLDIIAVPEYLKELSIIRFMVVCPSILGLFIYSYSKNFKKHWQGLSAITIIISGLGIVAMTLLDSEIAMEKYYVGAIQVIIYCYMLMRVRFLMASIAGWIIVGSYILSVMFLQDLPKDISSSNIFFLTTANILGMFGAYILEYFKRGQFYYEYMLHKEQEKVKESNILLEQRVNEATSELKRDIEERKRVARELVVAKEKAEEADRLKMAFLANMSHEIRTPMNGILGFTELLKRPNLTGEKRAEFIDIITRSGNRMLNTVNDIIEISKIETKQVVPEYSSVNINELINYLFAFFLPEAQAKGLKISFSAPLSSLESEILTDRNLLESAITNLVKNAIKYTYSGSVKFGYRILSEKTLPEMEFFVEDSGIGIPEDKKELIFDRFRQLEQDSGMINEGSGLGLAITKAYTDLIGGTIQMTSREKEGTTFTISIPYKKAPKSSEKSEFEYKLSTSKQEQLKILIAEDDSSSMLHLSIILEPYLKQLIKAENGKEAIEKCRENPDLDLVFMDIRMPELNGMEASRKIREFNTKVPIIAQTAFAMIGDREKILEAGCSDYITKPIKEDAVLDILQRYCF